MFASYPLPGPLARPLSAIETAAAAASIGFAHQTDGISGGGVWSVVCETEPSPAELADLYVALVAAAGAPLPTPTRIESATVIPSPGVALNLGTGDQRYDTLFCLTVNQASDARIKRDVSTLSGALGLPLVRALRPVTFRYAAGKREHLGFVAQEVRAALEAAAPGADLAVWCSTPVRDAAAAGLPPGVDSLESLRPDQLIASLVAAVQELAARDAAREAALRDLAARVAALEAARPADDGTAAEAAQAARDAEQSAQVARLQAQVDALREAVDALAKLNTAMAGVAL